MKAALAPIAMLAAMLPALLVAASPAMAQGTSAATAKPDEAEKAPAFVPADFDPPVLVEAEGFKLVPLGPDLVKVDFEAYMGSIEHLQQTFSRSTGWPREGITDADAMQDMLTEQDRFATRKSFAYGVLAADGSRELGSVYVSPSPAPGYDAMVRLWVTKADYDAGFDAQLYQWVQGWIEADWPFTKVAYPGRAIDWKTWDAVVAAGKSGD